MTIRKIAILRANALGDFLVTLPAIEAIKAKYPQAHVVLLGAPWHKEFLVPRRCAVDRVEVVPEYPGIRGNKATPEIEMQEFFGRMRAEEFDIALHFQGNGLTANSFILQLQAKITAGCTVEGAAPLDKSIPFYYYQNEISRYLEVASLIGAEPVSLEAKINVMPQEEEEVSSFLGLMTNREFVVLHPFSADLRREWPLANYHILADALYERGYGIVFTGLEKDAETIKEITGKMKHPATNACGVFSLGGLAALLKRAALVIAPDTGPLHLARAVQSATVGLYWAPNFINWSPLSREKNRPLVSWKMECSLCGIVPNEPYPFLPQGNCRHQTSFIADITPQMVLAEAQLLLNVQEKTSKNTERQFAGISESSA